MDVLKHRPKAMELALVQGGYALSDIRGEREVHTVETPPLGAARVLAHFTPTAGTVLAVCVLALGGAASVETGLLLPTLAAGVLGLGLHLLGRLEWGTTTVQHEVERPGMGHREVSERLVQWQEWQRIENEQKEKAAAKARKQGGH